MQKVGADAARLGSCQVIEVDRNRSQIIAALIQRQNVMTKRYPPRFICSSVRAKLIGTTRSSASVWKFHVVPSSVES